MSPRHTMPLLAALCVVLAFVAGAVVGGPLRDALGLEDDEDQTRAELIEQIDSSFYKKVDKKKLEEASLDGIVRSLNDRFSHYFTPAETKEFERAISDPTFEGIGVSVAEDDRGLRVVQVYDGSPAKKSGILKDDVIVAVTGKS